MGDAPFRGKMPRIGYPLHGKKHSPLLQKEEFKKILEGSKEYQQVVEREKGIGVKVSVLHKANRELKAMIAASWKKVVANDRRVWGQARLKALNAHHRRSIALRLYRNELAERLNRESPTFKGQYDRDEATEDMVADYAKEIEGIDLEGIFGGKYLQDGET
jgi:hypothetical protein